MQREIDILLGTQANASDIEEIKSQFHPSNTANVNIVPYEIYDEDGEEIKVGEVRKTINGVKKKKPIYRSFMSITTLIPKETTNFPNQSILNNLNIEHIREVNVVAYKSNRDAYAIVIFTIESGVWKWRGMESFGEGIVDITLEYTKTSDEWQPV